MRVTREPYASSGARAGCRGNAHSARHTLERSSILRQETGAAMSLRLSRPWRRLFGTLAALVSVGVVVAVGGVYSYASYRVQQITRVATPLPHLTVRKHYSDPFTVLFVGTDDRKGTHGEYGHQYISCNCSDTMILARVDPRHQRISLLSLPRDSYVHLTGLDELGKLNAAFSKGADNLIQTVEQDFGIPINHYVLVDLASFKRTVNALGGVDMNVPMPIRDKNAHLAIDKTGCQRLTGDEALAISRARELQYEQDGSWIYDPTWEYGRNRREQIFLKVLARQVIQRGLANPLRANRVIATVTDHGMVTDRAVKTSELVSLAGQFAGFDADTIRSYTLPTYTQEHTPDWGDVEILEPKQDIATITAWYGASVPDAGITLPAAGITKPVHPAAKAGSTAPGTRPGTPSPSSKPRSAAPPPNQPRPWDPRGCASG
jgi:LCP family protein required for cell wall assembly